MSEFTLSTAIQAWRHRKWYFIIPALIIPLLGLVVAFKLPPVFESKSTILIEEQQIPQDFVRSTVSGYADQHVQILTQQILSRTKLWEIVEQFNLYAEERKKETKEAILDQMRKDIAFQTISAEVNEGKKGRSSKGGGFTIAFSIAYQGRNPAMVQKVTSTLTSLYLEENLKYRGEQAQTTTKFLEAELKELKDKIEFLGGKITNFKEKYPGALPEMREFNLAQANSLENELKRIDGDIQTAQNQKIYLEGLLGTSQVKKSESEPGGGPKDPRGRLQVLNEQLKTSRAKFSEDHPEVQRLIKEKTQLEQLLKVRQSGDLQSQKKLGELQAELAAKQAKYSEQHPEVKRLKIEIAQLLSESPKDNPSLSDVDLGNPVHMNLITQVQQLTNQMNTLTQLRQKQQEKLTLFRQRLEETPRIEQEYLALQRDYQNSHTKYQEVMNKLLEARISEGMEQHQKGEKFTLVDPASLPQEPIKPKKKMIMLAGLVLGLGAGLALFAGRESLDPSIKSVNELAELTKMAPLGVIARITTPVDLARQRRQRRLVLTGTVLSVLLAITLVHFFYMDLWILASRLQRLIDRL